MYKNGVAIDALNVIKKPQKNALEEKEKAVFMATIKNISNKFEKEINKENKTLPNKFERTKDRSEINIL